MNQIKEKVIFLHIPKCGGTTLKEIIYKIFGEQNTLKIWDPKFDATVSEAGFLEMKIEDISNYSCITGHFFWDKIKAKLGNEIVQNYYVCSIIREPVAQVLSLWNYILQHPDLPDYARVSKMKFHDFVDNFTVNQQCRFICGEDENNVNGKYALELINRDFDKVVTLDKSDILIKKICDMFNYQLPEYEIHNQSAKLISRNNLSQETIDYILEVNKEDYIMYQGVVEKLSLSNAS